MLNGYNRIGRDWTVVSTTTCPDGHVCFPSIRRFSSIREVRAYLQSKPPCTHTGCKQWGFLGNIQISETQYYEKECGEE